MTAIGLTETRSLDIAQFFTALADETRLAIVRMLGLSDLKAGEIVQALHAPQNAVSYHLRQLHAAGLLRDRHSSLDARDVYYSVDLDRLQMLYCAAGEALHPGMAPGGSPATATPQGAAPMLRVLFLCTHNSARSQLAEGILRRLGGDAVQAWSAGCDPRELHPLTIQLLRAHGADLTLHFAKTLDRFVGHSFDYIITVCDRVRERCPVFPDDPKRIHWSVPDPTLVEEPVRQRQAFAVVERELTTRIRYLLNLPYPRTGQRLRIWPVP